MIHLVKKGSKPVATQYKRKRIEMCMSFQQFKDEQNADETSQQQFQARTGHSTSGLSSMKPRSKSRQPTELNTFAQTHQRQEDTTHFQQKGDDPMQGEFRDVTH